MSHCTFRIRKHYFRFWTMAPELTISSGAYKREQSHPHYVASQTSCPGHFPIIHFPAHKCVIPNPFRLSSLLKYAHLSSLELRTVCLEQTAANTRQRAHISSSCPSSTSRGRQDGHNSHNNSPTNRLPLPSLLSTPNKRKGCDNTADRPATCPPLA